MANNVCPPDGDNGTTGLGEQDKRWSDLWLSGTLSDGTRFVTAAQMAEAYADIGRVAPGGAAYIYWPTDVASGVGTYQNLYTYASGTILEADTQNISAASGAVILDSYISGTLGINSIPAGLWDFITYGSVSSTAGNTKFKYVVSKYDSGGTLTELFTQYSDEVNVVLAAEIPTVSVQPAFSVLQSDKLVIDYFGTTTTAGTIGIAFYHGGTSLFSRVNTPITRAHNDLPMLQGGYNGSYLHLGTTGATAGSYYLATVVVDAYGRVMGIANGTQETGGGGGTNREIWNFTAANFDNPNSASWAVNALAVASVDGTYGQTIRCFSGTAEEGVGWGPMLLPDGAGTFRWTAHQAKDTSGAGSTVWKLYTKRFPHAGAAGTWSSVLLDTETTSGTFYDKLSGVTTFAAADAAAGTHFWFELTRASTHGSDTFAGVLKIDHFKVEMF